MSDLQTVPFFNINVYKEIFLHIVSKFVVCNYTFGTFLTKIDGIFVKKLRFKILVSPGFSTNQNKRTFLQILKFFF